MSSILAPGNEWPPQMLVGDRLLMIPGSNTTTTAAASSSRTATAALTSNSARAMERPTQDAGPLKCPRCDSSNTKFCYYNNYSLSQPRHFCKACKRYWTRGGTLRSVPVGGGCRKNKRVKKPSAAASTPSSDTPSLGPPPPRQPLSLPIPSQIDISPMFYPLPSDMRDLNFPAIRGRMDPPSSFTCSLQNGNLYDPQPQLSGLALGFSPNHHYSGDEYHSGFGASLSHLQQPAAVSSAAPLLHDYPLFGSSLPDSSLKPPKKPGLGDYRGLLPYEEDLEGMVKQVKMEGEYNAAVAGSSNRIDWQLPCENPSQSMTTAAHAAAADSSFLYWNAAMGGAGWPDTSYESSVAPLI